jgi:hypothetical protein
LILGISTYLYFKPYLMKTVRYIILVSSISLLVASCSVFSSNKRGCPGGGQGAEKLLDGSKQPKSKKFKG